MTFDELREQIHAITEQCDKSREQQAVRSILLTLQSAMLTRRHEALMQHVCDFAQRELISLRQ